MVPTYKREGQNQRAGTDVRNFHSLMDAAVGLEDELLGLRLEGIALGEEEILCQHLEWRI